MESISCDLVLRTPYRGVETGLDTLRIKIRAPDREVVIDIDDLAIEVREADGSFVLGAGAPRRSEASFMLASEIVALFVVERQPRTGFLTWFGVFARRRGRADRLVFESETYQVARFVERTIEQRLGLDDEPVRGELRVD